MAKVSTASRWKTGPGYSWQTGLHQISWQAGLHQIAYPCPITPSNGSKGHERKHRGSSLSGCCRVQLTDIHQQGREWVRCADSGPSQSISRTGCFKPEGDLRTKGCENACRCAFCRPTPHWPAALLSCGVFWRTKSSRVINLMRSFWARPCAHPVFVGLRFAYVSTALRMTVPRVALKVIVRA